MHGLAQTVNILIHAKKNCTPCWNNYVGYSLYGLSLFIMCVVYIFVGQLYILYFVAWSRKKREEIKAVTCTS